MNSNLRELMIAAGYAAPELASRAITLVELLKQSIYDEVKQELIDDAAIDAETNPMLQEYLKGCNGGTVDALCHIKNFGIEIEL